MSSEEVKGTGDSRDEIVAELVDEYLRRLRAGESVEPEAFAKAHPECAEDLLDMLHTMGALADLGSSGTGGTAALALEDVSGRQLGDYTLRRQIGRGGMGVVYEAWENSMDRVVALKVLPPGVAADSKAFMRFLREAKTAGQLNHQNIVGIYSTGVQEGTPWYSMEFVEGQTLAQVLSRIKGVDEDTETPFGRKGGLAFYSNVARVFVDVANGLQHAHSKRVIHRDIKPSNLILDTEGRLRILDFGLARLEGQESLTLSGDLVGTPHYMSPEQARRRKIPIDHRTDIYSLGATMYEALAGRPPFRGKDHADTLSQIIERDPAEPRKVNPRVPKDLETVVLKCLRKDPADRYGTAEALEQDLRRFERGDAIEARQEVTYRKALRRLWRHRILAAAVACALTLALAAGFILDYRARDALRLREELYREKVLAAVMKIEVGRHLRESGSIPPDVLSWSHTFVRSVRRRPLSPRVQLQQGSWAPHVEEGIADLEEAMELAPQRVDAPYHLARALALLGLEEAATETLDRAKREHPEFLPLRIMREQLGVQARGKDHRASVSQLRPTDMDGAPPWLIAWRKAQQAVRPTEWEKAVAAYTALLENLEPEAPPLLGLYMEARLGRGRLHLRVGDLDGAIEDFAAARERWPGLSEPQLLLGTAYLRAGNDRRAEMAFEGLYRQARDPDKAALAVADVYRRSRGLDDRFERALVWAERIRDPATRELWRAYFLRWLGRLGEALAAAGKALEHAPERARARYELGVILEELGKEDDAARAYSEALERQPDLFAALYRRARLRAKKEDFEGAIADCDEVLRQNPRVVDIRFLRHEDFPRLWFSGDPERAVRNADRVVDLESEHPCNYYDRAELHTRIRNWESARADYERALALHAEDPSRCFPYAALSHLGLGRIAQEEGRLEEAEDEFSEAIRLQCNCPEAFWLRAGLRARSGRLEEAWADVDKVRGMRMNAKGRLSAVEYYNWACIHALAAKTVEPGGDGQLTSDLARQHCEKAIELLGRAVEQGFTDVDTMRKDPDLEAVRGHPAFRKLLEEGRVESKPGSTRAPGG